jgi:signal transduction histidine kinase
MNNKMERERLGELFKELEQLATGFPGNTPDIQRNLQELRGPLLKLKKQMQVEGNTQLLDEDNNPAGFQERLYRRASTSSLYEKDRGGFAFSEGKLEPVHDTLSTSPENNILTAPMAIGSDVIGEVQIEPRPNQQLNDDQILLTRAIAQQASLQIQNLKLLSEAERSRAEAEAATRRFVHEGWDSYLDAIQHQERIGYIYDRSSVSPCFEEFHFTGGIQIPVKVTEEEIGIVYIEPGSTYSLSQSDTALIKAVADQVAQQVENIRLLADASRARAEAEESMQRLARENWQVFASEREESGFAFVYDALQVTQQDEPRSELELDLVNPITVQGEVIGQLGVTCTHEISREDAHLAAALASQVSTHLEALRLNAELEKRAQELQELDRLKSAFLANMSHELRTPLNSILGFSEVILLQLDGPITPEMTTDLQLIQKNGQHLMHLINDVLDMSKIESGRMNLIPETFNVHSVLDEVRSITSTLASERNSSLFIEEDSDQEVEIFADITRFRQVIINLVNNAIKFTENGKIAIRATRPDDVNLLITVKDNGIGIPPEKLEDIFQEFTQVDTSTTRKVGGTGLGLPISRRLVEMHGGRLWAESKGIEGEGSTFFVELPLEARITDVIEKTEK